MAGTTLLLDTKATERRRMMCGLTQAGLAAIAGVHVTHLNAVLRGNRKPTGPFVKRIADALGCTIADIVLDEPVVDEPAVAT